MAGWKFERITSCLRLIVRDPPAYRDKYHEVRDLITAWNDHMKKMFIPEWVSCVDESMSIWISKWTCPGFMFIPRKPHPIGNEYHSAYCGQSEIMFAVELMEGKDAPKEAPKKDFANAGITAGLLLRLYEELFSAGKIVILDSDFCVLQALIELKKCGVFASALVKKRRYWPKHVDGEAIAEHLKDKAVGVKAR